MHQCMPNRLSDCHTRSSLLLLLVPSASYVLSTKEHVVVLGVVFLLHVCLAAPQ